MRVQVLGPLGVWHGGRGIELGTPQQRAVLGLLVLADGCPLSRAELGDALWDGTPPRSAANLIQTYVKRLRRLLEPHRPPRTPSAVLPRVGEGYALRLPEDGVDLPCFRRLTGQAEAAHRDGDARRAAALLGEALRLWQGPPLADLPLLAGHPALVALAGERRAAVARYGETMIAAGAAAEALPALARAAAEAPLDEGVQARLVRAYDAVGQRDSACAVYLDTRRRLADELGVDPGPELTSAYTALLRSAPAVPTAPAAPPAPRAASAEPVPAPPLPHPVPAQLPADVYGFCGRTAELRALDDLAAAGRPRAGVPDPPAVAVVSGTAGAGKTALAVHWAHRVRERFPDGQLYVNLRGYDPDRPVPWADALTRFLRALGLTGAHIPLDPEERAARYRTETAGLRMLVVLDNALSVEQVRPLLPGSPTCAVLVTSRDSLAGLVALHGAGRLALGPLPPGEATGLLDLLVGERARADPASCAVLAERCARLPLALRVAAELAASRPETPLPALVAELADQRRRLDLLDAGGDERAAMRSVFSWSYRHLPPAAARTFRLLSLHPGPDVGVPATAALTGESEEHTARSLGTLTRAHLVQSTRPGRHTMHDLLRAYADGLCRELDGARGREQARTRLFDHCLAGAAAAMDALYPAERHHRPSEPGTAAGHRPRDAAAARAWLDAELPALGSLCAAAAEGPLPGHAVRLAAVLFRHLDGGRHTEALSFHTHALRAAERTGDAAGQAHALTSLGAVHWRLGEHRSAEGHLRRALALHERTGDVAGRARALSNLGNVHWRLGDLPRAADCHRWALKLYEAAGDLVGQARTLTNLGNVSLRQGEPDRAAEHQTRALALQDATGDRVGRARTLSNLGNVRLRQDRAEAAAAHHRQALELFRELGHTGGEAYALTGLGEACLRQGRPGPAADHLRRALRLFSATGERYGEAAALNGLAEALCHAGRPAEALVHHVRARAVAAVTGEREERARAHAGAELAHRLAYGGPGPAGSAGAHTSS
ncbi:tetratricopeptide repeat protein [Streptomyces capparidis]